ncbi:MAG: hypothetical protein AB1485_02975 [Candidatus Thermoplasmatota archaeon]
MKKKMLLGIIISTIVIIVAAISIIFYLPYYLPKEEYRGGCPAIWLNQTVENDYWVLTVEYYPGGKWKAPSQWFKYRLYNQSLRLVVEGYLDSIKYSPSEDYNITWLDADNDSKIWVGDMFLISKRGGSEGKAESGYFFVLLWYKENYNGTSAMVELL